MTQWNPERSSRLASLRQSRMSRKQALSQAIAELNISVPSAATKVIRRFGTAGVKIRADEVMKNPVRLDVSPPSLAGGHLALAVDATSGDKEDLVSPSNTVKAFKTFASLSPDSIKACAAAVIGTGSEASSDKILGHTNAVGTTERDGGKSECQPQTNQASATTNGHQKTDLSDDEVRKLASTFAGVVDVVREEAGSPLAHKVFDLITHPSFAQSKITAFLVNHPSYKRSEIEAQLRAKIEGARTAQPGTAPSQSGWEGGSLFDLLDGDMELARNLLTIWEPILDNIRFVCNFIEKRSSLIPWGAERKSIRLPSHLRAPHLAGWPVSMHKLKNFEKSTSSFLSDIAKQIRKTEVRILPPDSHPSYGALPCHRDLLLSKPTTSALKKPEVVKGHEHSDAELAENGRITDAPQKSRTADIFKGSYRYMTRSRNITDKLPKKRQSDLALPQRKSKRLAQGNQSRYSAASKESRKRKAGTPSARRPSVVRKLNFD